MDLHEVYKKKKINKMYQRLKESTLTPEEASARRVEMIKAGYNPYNQEDITKFDELKASGAKIETQQERWKRQDQESQTALKDTAEKARQEQQIKTDEALKPADEAVRQTLEGLRKTTELLSQSAKGFRDDTAKLAAMRADTAKFKEDLSTKTKTDVEAIKSRKVNPGTPEWDAIEKRVEDSTKNIEDKRSWLPYLNTQAMTDTSQLPPQDMERIRQQLINTAKFKAAQAAETKTDVEAIKSRKVNPGTPEWDAIEKRVEDSTKNIEDKTISKNVKSNRYNIRPISKLGAKMTTSKDTRYISENTEETKMDKIKQIIKENIIFNFMENAKPEFARRGVEKQRPKSWSKGTKSGSDKRKMREAGKRAAREMNEASAQSWGPDVAGAAQDDATARAYAEGQPEDPYHRVSADEREEMAQTLASDYGTEKIRAGLLGKIATLAGSAHKTSSKQDDLAAMERIQHLIGYGNAIIDAKHKPLPSDQGMPF